MDMLYLAVVDEEGAVTWGVQSDVHLVEPFRVLFEHLDKDNIA